MFNELALSSSQEENTKITLTGVEGKDLELRGKDQEAPVESGKRSAWHRQQEDAKEDKRTQVGEDEYAFDSSDEEASTFNLRSSV